MCTAENVVLAATPLQFWNAIDFPVPLFVMYVIMFINEPGIIWTRFISSVVLQACNKLRQIFTDVFSFM
jgi:hypothetical protein